MASDDEDDYDDEDVELSQEDTEDAIKKWFYGLSKEDREFVLQNKKREVLDKMQKAIEETDSEIIGDLQKPEFQQAFHNYLFALRVVANGFADYFLQTVRRDDKTQTLGFEYEFYKNGKKVEASKIISESGKTTAMVEKDEDD